MFDAKALLEQLAKGAAPAAASQAQSQGGGLADILGQLTGGGGQGGGLADILGKLTQAAPPAGHANAAPSAGPNAGPSAGGGLEDILRKLIPANSPSGESAGQAGASQDGGLGGGLGDILGKLQQQLGQGGAGGGGSITDILGQMLGQATQGVKEGAGRISDATGAGAALNKATGGQTTDDLLAKLKELVANNQLAAGAAAGGLGGLLVGSKSGRGVIGSAAKLGALALIGGLAYKAVQNYQAGKPLITGASALTAPAPDGTGFEPSAQTNESATLLIRTMIAAAAADGRIDEHEKTKIIGSFEQMGGFNDEARAFVQAELSNPASIDDLAGAVTSKQGAVQVYTAARVAIEADSTAEQDFLASLADRLGIDNKLAAHIDATARSAAV
jgi:uncharacterized membrane protein YebE (DUF533 family)